MPSLALHTPSPQLSYGYGRTAHARALAEERPATREPTTPVRPSVGPAERGLLAVERSLYLDRHPRRRRRARRR
jgi:transposase